MAQDDQHEPQLPPVEPFRATWGPLDGPILNRSDPPPMRLDDGHNGRLEVVAWPTGFAYDRDGPPVAVYKITVGMAEMPGRFLCVGRKFVELGDSAEGRWS